MPVPNVQSITADDGQRNCPKYFNYQNKILKLVCLFGFHCKITITMYGHVNIKFVNVKQEKETYLLYIDIDSL